MTTYNFRYRIQSAPQATSDGSGQTLWDMYSVKRPAGTTDPFEIVPGYHKTANIHSLDLKTVNDMPDGTAQQKAAKNAAAKNLLAGALELAGYTPPEKHWDVPDMQSYADANDSATLEASRLNTYVTVTLGQTFPLDLML